MKREISNNTFFKLSNENMIKIYGGEDCAPTGSFWLSDLIKYLKSLF